MKFYASGGQVESNPIFHLFDGHFLYPNILSIGLNGHFTGPPGPRDNRKIHYLTKSLIRFVVD